MGIGVETICSVGPGPPALHINKRSVPGKADPAGEGAERIYDALTIDAAETREAGVLAAQIRAAAIRLDAEDPLALLQVEPDLAAAERAGGVDYVAEARDIGGAT